MLRKARKISSKKNF